MLKKNNKILVGCLALLLVMAVGYALFSETITINGTATAKGEFDMTVTCTKGLLNVFPANQSYLLEGYQFENIEENRLIVENNYKNDSCAVNGNSVSFSAELTQPEAARNFTVKITNNGTMDASLDLVDTIENAKYKTCTTNLDTNEEHCKNNVSSYADLINSDILGFEYSDGTIINATSDEGRVSDFVTIDFDNDFVKITLEPGESMYMVFQTVWYYLGSDLETSNKVLQKQDFTYTFKFSQPTTN